MKPQRPRAGEDKRRKPRHAVDRSRGLVSLTEELDAVDRYEQRIDATEDPGLIAILRHNRDDEQEHASTLLGWLRRHDASWEGRRGHDVIDESAAATDRNPDPGPRLRSTASSLGIGSLRGKEIR
jgi:hypothetical protein